MVKHTQTICLSVFGHFVGLALKGLRKLLAIRQKSRVPSFREMMDSFVVVAYASSLASRTLL